MAQNKTRRYECIYCIDLFSSREECKAHPCYAVKNEKEDTRWSEDMIKLLISLYQEHEKKFQLVNIYQKNFLYVIAEIMKLQGYQDITGDMCYNKWMGLRRLYMDEKTEQMNSKRRLRIADICGQTSSNSEFKSTFRYFDAMDSVLGLKPDIVGIPGGIDSSDPDTIENFNRSRLAREAAKRARKCTARESADTADSEDDELSTKLPYRYRAFLRRIDKKEERTQRCHEEQQALRRESLNILRNILTSKGAGSSAPHRANQEFGIAANLRLLDEVLHAVGIQYRGPNIIPEERGLNNVADIPNEEEMLDELDNIAPNLMLNEEMHFDLGNNAAYMPNQEFGVEVPNDIADVSDGEMDVRSCLLKEFRSRKMQRRNNRQRRFEESHALIRECSALFHNIQLNK